MLKKEKINEEILTEEEVEIVNRIKEMLNEILGFKEIKFKKKVTIKEKRKELVFFKKSYPSFIATNGLIYGPFSKGDIANLPRIDAINLQRKGIVTIIKETSV